MSWIRSSEAGAVLVLLAVTLAAVGTAAALSASAENVPEDARAGTEINATITVEDPFTDTADQWTLQGHTELEGATWLVTVFDQGERVDRATFDGQNFEMPLNRSDGGDEVVFELEGTTPAVENHTYSPPERFTMARLNRTEEGIDEDINTWRVHHYTNDSREARQAIDSAAAAINATDNEDAERSLQQAISSYNNGNFENALSNARDAENAAQQAEQSQQTMQLALFGVGGLVVLLLIGGGIHYWRSQQDDYDKLG